MSGKCDGLSVVVITFNEERNIRQCLESVSWAGEIIVVDSLSTDRTVAIAGEFTGTVLLRPWEGYASAKEFAVSHATRPWILWLDADERVSGELADSIRGVVSAGSGTVDAYEVPRRAMFLGRWIRHCGWYPGYVTRLFRRESARFTSTGVHEKVQTEKRPARLKGDILHFTDDNLFHYFSKYNRYTSLAAEDVETKGETVTLLGLIIRPPFQFVKMYLLKFGFLDGVHGLVLCLASATYVFVKYAKVWELHQRRRD